MKKARDVHRLLDRVNLTVNTDADREVLERVLRASRKSTAPVSHGDAQRILVKGELWRFAFWRKAGYLAAAFLIISSLLACCFLSRRVFDLKAELEKVQARQDVVAPETDNSATINLYLKEHQDVIARRASLDSAPPPVQMRVSQQDILYYESFDAEPGYMSPGIIVRGPASQHQIDSQEAPLITNGHTLTLSKAEQAAGFDVVLPSWLDPGYALDQIRRIEGRDTLQLLYTDGINSVSLFEQPLDGQRGLEPKDFREYAVYRNKEQTGGTILAWRDNARSYVLIGNAELSQLMNMAQSISATK